MLNVSYVLVMDLIESKCISEAFIKCNITPGTYSLYRGLFTAPDTHNVAIQFTQCSKTQYCNRTSNRNTSHTMQNKVTILHLNNNLVNVSINAD